MAEGRVKTQSLIYFEGMLAAVRAKWHLLRLSLFNQSSPESRQAWKDIEAERGSCPRRMRVSSFFKQISRDIGAGRAWISRAAEPAFQELQRLQQESQVERESSELEFALVLAECCIGQIVTEKHVSQAMQQLPNNLFVKHSASIKRIVKNAKTKANHGQRSFTRSQLLYLRLSGVEMNVNSLVAKVGRDDWSERWEAAMGVEKESKNGNHSESKVDEESAEATIPDLEPKKRPAAFHVADSESPIKRFKTTEENSGAKNHEWVEELESEDFLANFLWEITNAKDDNKPEMQELEEIQSIENEIRAEVEGSFPELSSPNYPREDVTDSSGASIFVPSFNVHNFFASSDNASNVPMDSKSEEDFGGSSKDVSKDEEPGTALPIASVETPLTSSIITCKNALRIEGFESEATVFNEHYASLTSARRLLKDGHKEKAKEILEKIFNNILNESPPRKSGLLAMGIIIGIYKEHFE